MNVHRLLEILEETTYLLRKGEPVTENVVAGVKVVQIENFPHKSQVEPGIKVDCHFVVVVVDKPTAKKYRDEVLDILKDWPSESWGQAVSKLEEGPSYIVVGGVLGDQGSAFLLFALGQVLGFWNVVTPKSLGITGPEADEVAGLGLVMIDGFKH